MPQWEHWEWLWVKHMTRSPQAPITGSIIRYWAFSLPVCSYSAAALESTLFSTPVDCNPRRCFELSISYNPRIDAKCWSSSFVNLSLFRCQSIENKVVPLARFKLVHLGILLETRTWLWLPDLPSPWHSHLLHDILKDICQVVLFGLHTRQHLSMLIFFHC